MPTIAGTLERIVFRNQETHYTVARLRPDGTGRLFRDDLLTIVGALAGVNVGELIEVTGEWELHPQHGRHLRVASFTSHAPVTPAGLKRYLGSGVIKGVGPKTAERIVEHFGEETLSVLELEPARLTEVSGISTSKRDRIVAGWEEQHEIRDVMLFLQGHGVSPSLGTKIYRQYGKQSITVIRENPYVLERDISGVGFKTADALAVKLGLPRDAQPRYMTGLKHALSEAASADGHCYLPRDDLFLRAAALLDAPPEALSSALDQLLADKEAFAAENNIYLAPFFYAENGTARRLRLVLSAPSTLPPVSRREWRETFAALARERGITLAERQKEAVQLAYTSKVCVLTGGPGVGKTTTIRALLDVLDAHSVEYALAAPTGRAAKRMAEATGRPAKTLHRLLEFLPSANDFAYNERRPLPARFVVVDEVSMLDILLAYRLVKALPPEAHLLLVGDADQLPSVGPGSVFADIIRSEAVPVVRLTELFRQASQSAIVVTAHGINRGEMPALQPSPQSDFYFLRAENPLAAQRLVTDLVARRLPARYGFDPIADIQVLSPMYRGPAGVIALNAALQARLNASASAFVSYGEHILRAGDKVMQVRNNYDKGPAGVFNGDVGRIVDVAVDTNQISVRYLDESGAFTVAYEPHELDELTLAYACSIHRAQGSEYPCVVLPLVTQHYLLLQRNLLYTALTRARRLCVLVGDVRALRRAVENNALAARNTGLAERLRGPKLGGDGERHAALDSSRGWNGAER
ncbi:MAG TPA: ATP-dependent RecD-like DNA helicase [Ktedonobacterales bacterium]|nr:ATP-dependent RecD-like DNA helicase [Ktedonobacterales bacterium]